MNDLNAIQAGSSNLPPNASVRIDKSAIAVRLQKLDELYNVGAISKEERETRRHDILNEI